MDDPAIGFQNEVKLRRKRHNSRTNRFMIL